MSGFSADWLACREPYDRRARNRDVLAAVAERFASYPSIAVVDLACGTGATLRAVSAALPHRQSWRLVDNDLSLLARVQQTAGAAIAVRAIPIDLARDLEAALDGPVDLVTTSAFLDLASAEWIERLVTEIAARELPFYAALSYDGRVTLAPRDVLDAAIITAFKTGIKRPIGGSDRRSAPPRLRKLSRASSRSVTSSQPAHPTGCWVLWTIFSRRFWRV